MMTYGHLAWFQKPNSQQTLAKTLAYPDARRFRARSSATCKAKSLRWAGPSAGLADELPELVPLEEDAEVVGTLAAGLFLQRGCADSPSFSAAGCGVSEPAAASEASIILPMP
eukprot:1795302-Alexandrium_andersonii.AAC.1